METTLTIDGKQVRFRKTGGTMLAYKREFGQDLLTDLSKISKYAIAAKAFAELGDSKMDASAVISAMNLDVFYNILYVMAKSADPSIGDQLEWLDGFEEFPVIDIFNQLMPMLNKEMQVDPKNASAAAENQAAG